MVVGRNFHLMAPFELLVAGFCTEFRRASFVCSCPRADFWTTGRIWGLPGRHFGSGTFWGPEKHTFVMKVFSGEVSGDSP